MRAWSLVEAVAAMAQVGRGKSAPRLGGRLGAISIGGRVPSTSGRRVRAGDRALKLESPGRGRDRSAAAKKGWSSRRKSGWTRSR